MRAGQQVRIWYRSAHSDTVRSGSGLTTLPQARRSSPAPSKSARPSPLSPEIGPDLGEIVEVGAYMFLQDLLHSFWTGKDDPLEGGAKTGD